MDQELNLSDSSYLYVKFFSLQKMIMLAPDQASLTTLLHMIFVGPK